MCGILFYRGDKQTEQELINKLGKIKSRGPDNTKYKYINKKFFGFTRLCINGIDETGNQPFIVSDVALICNGEIYNYEELINKYGFKGEYKSRSDCEIVIHMYKKFGIHRTLNELDGVFSFVLYDTINDKVFAARDQLGIRSLFYSTDENKEITIASEMKAMNLNSYIYQFPPGSYLDLNTGIFYKYAPFRYLNTGNVTGYEYKEDVTRNIEKNIRELLTSAVNKRQMSDRPVGCLLSGGLDSTLVTALVSKHYPEFGLNTYSIGLSGSVDLKYAKIAAKYLKTNHTTIELTEKEFLSAIEETIYVIESYDTTTVRASVGNYLVSKYIKENSEDTVIFCGDVSDEIFGSYRGFTKAPSMQDFNIANQDMLESIHFFDVLRSDKSISGAGLEARVPFGDKKLVDYVMRMSAQYKQFDNEIMEKKILRDAFKGVLPEELLYRRKEAFSDGVSSHQRSWFQIIREFVDSLYTDDEVGQKSAKYIHNTPYDKESLYYREIFEKYYPGHGKVIPYFWRHPFCSQIDPSARLLDVY